MRPDDKCYLTKSVFSFGLTRNERRKEEWEVGREAGREEGRKLDIIPQKAKHKT